ncbi:YwmB family TATA-box binding protein [Pontibacillus salicampi]|uniref:YwmB family TATA-box binding protein n=1 Tax=Pontibacillus salicampi TaxID=1449801 RepID=A0ABV6LSG5_9BACI
MKHFSIIVVILLCIQPQLFQTAQAVDGDEFLPLEDMLTFAEDYELNVSEWSLQMKRQIKPEEVPHYVEALRDRYPDIQKDESSKRVRLVLSNHHKNDMIIESFIILLAKDTHSYAEVVYNVTGENTELSTISDFFPRFQAVKTGVFQENTTIFTCVKTDYNGMIDGVLLLEEFSNRVKMKELQTLNEEDFISVTGYSSQWTQAIPYENGTAANAQIALREGLGAKTTLTFGTPIITSEY